MGGDTADGNFSFHKETLTQISRIMEKGYLGAKVSGTRFVRIFLIQKDHP